MALIVLLTGEDQMSKEGVYGFPCVENPHDFTPDSESCTEAEITFWEDAKKRWDAGEHDVPHEFFRIQ